MTTPDPDETMADRYREQGYDPDTLVHPKDVQPGDITDETVVVADTVVRNPDPDAPATTRDLTEFEVGPDDVFRADEVKEVTDGAVSYPADEPVEYAVRWSYRAGGVPNFQSIGYGDALYGPDSEFDDPQRWERLVSHVWGRSDDFIRFRL